VTTLDTMERLTGCGENCAYVYFGQWSIQKFIIRAVDAGTSGELVARLIARPAWQSDYHSPSRHLTPIDNPRPWTARQVVVQQFAGRRNDPVARMPGVAGACDRNRMRADHFAELMRRAGRECRI